MLFYLFIPYPPPPPIQINILSLILIVYLTLLSLSCHLACKTHKFCLLYQGEKTYGLRTQNDTRKLLLGMWHSLLSQLFLFLLPDQRLYISKNVYIYIYVYTGCHRRNGPNFGRVFLMLNYTDITQNTYIQS